MKKIIRVTLFFAVVLFIGCEKKPEPLPPKPVFKAYIDMPEENWPPKDNNSSDFVDLSDFDISDANHSSQNSTGKASIIGSISFITPNHNKINGTYANIYLRKLIAGQNIAYGDYVQSAISDNNGKFEFRKIPNGKYKVSGVMNCGVECGYETNKTITLSKIINLDRNSTYSVNLSNIIHGARQ